MADARRMGKSELFSHFAERFEVKRTQAREFFDELTALAEKELKRSGEFVLPGMVKLVVQKRKARMGRNPATGEAIKIPGEDRRQGPDRQAAEGRRSAAQVARHAVSPPSVDGRSREQRGGRARQPLRDRSRCLSHAPGRWAMSRGAAVPACRQRRRHQPRHAARSEVAHRVVVEDDAIAGAEQDLRAVAAQSRAAFALRSSARRRLPCHR